MEVTTRQVKNAWRFISNPEFNGRHISFSIYTLNSKASTDATSTLINK